MNEKIKYGILAFIVLIVVYYLISSPRENFEGSQKVEEVKIPALYNRETGQLMSGSELITSDVPDEVATAWGAAYGTNDNLDDGNNGIYGLNYAMCSKSCCGPQYPPPFDMDKDVVVDKMKGEFVPNGIQCNNNWQNAGCLCMTKDQQGFLSSRGGNCGK